MCRKGAFCENMSLVPNVSRSEGLLPLAQFDLRVACAAMPWMRMLPESGSVLSKSNVQILYVNASGE